MFCSVFPKTNAGSNNRKSGRYFRTDYEEWSARLGPSTCPPAKLPQQSAGVLALRGLAFQPKTAPGWPVTGEIPCALFEALAMFTRGMEAHRGPLFHDDLQDVAVGGEVYQVVVRVAGHVFGLLLLEIAPRGVVREREPARGMDGGLVVQGVHPVFALQQLRHHLELQLADGAEERVAADEALEFLDRPLLAEFAQALLQLLGLDRVARARGAKQLRREIRNALEAQGLALGEGIADLQLAVVVDADDVAGNGVVHAHAFVGEERARVGELDLASEALVLHLHARGVTPGTNTEERDAVAVPGIHVCLDLEYKTGERRFRRLHRPRPGIARPGWRRPLHQRL